MTDRQLQRSNQVYKSWPLGHLLLVISSACQTIRTRSSTVAAPPFVAVGLGLTEIGWSDLYTSHGAKMSQIWRLPQNNAIIYYGKIAIILTDGFCSVKLALATAGQQRQFWPVLERSGGIDSWKMNENECKLC